MKIKVLPTSSLGKWSGGLLLACFMLIAVGTIIASVQGPRTDQTFFSNPALSIPMLSGMASGIFAFFTGIGAIIKSKERSALTFVTTGIGFLLLIFILGESVVPH